MADLLFFDFVQEAPNACVTDTNAPTFPGIQTLTPQANGALLATWNAASGTFTPPAFYDVYIAAGSGVSDAVLFQSSNIVCTKRGLSAKIWTLGDEVTFLGVNQPYTVGVRARSSTNIGETNTAKLSAISEGVIPDCFTQVYADLLAQVSALTTEVSNLAAENAVFVASNATYTAQNATFSSHLAALLSQIASFAAENSTYSGQNAAFAAGLSTLTTELATFAAENSVFIAQNAALAVAIADLENAVNALDSALTLAAGGVEGIVGEVEPVEGEAEC